jgi:hypothetical protein
MSSREHIEDFRIRHTAGYNILKTVEKYYPQRSQSTEFFLSFSAQQRNFIVAVAEAFWRDGCEAAKEIEKYGKGENNEWNNFTDSANNGVQESTRATA